MKFLATLLILLKKISNKIRMHILISKFKSTGKNVIFNPNDFFTYHNISIGNDVFIAHGASFSATNAEIIIGNKVMFGPNVTMITGDHRMDVIGEYMYDVHDKLPENDVTIILEDDIWIGTNVTILKGVKIAKGSVVAAGAVVTKSFPAYSIIGGVPAKLIKERFTSFEIIEHELKIKNKQV